MIVADWVALALVAAFFLAGVAAGFGKGLKFFTSGIFGIIISVFVCYSIGGLVLKLEFVRTLLDKFTAALTDKNGFCDFLLKIHVDVVVYYIVLFIIVQILRIIIVAILKNIAEINNAVFKIINRVLGAVFFLAVLTLIALTVFQIIQWIGGNTAQNFAQKLEGSFFKLDKLFENNPLLALKDRLSVVLAAI